MNFRLAKVHFVWPSLEGEMFQLAPSELKALIAHAEWLLSYQVLAGAAGIATSACTVNILVYSLCCLRIEQSI